MADNNLAQQPIPSGGSFNPVASVLRHKWLTLTIFLVMTAIGVYLSAQPVIPKYTVYASVLVSSRFVPNIESNNNLELRSSSQYILYMEQQLGMITSRNVIKEALQDPEVRKYWMKPDEIERNAVTRLKRGLKARNKRRNPYINVTLTSTQREGLHIVLNKVVESYLKKSQRENVYRKDERIATMEKRRQTLGTDLEQLQQERNTIAEQLGVTTFKEDSLNPYDSILINTTEAHKIARRQRIEAEARLSSMSMRQEGSRGKTVLDSIVADMIANDTVLQNYQSRLQQRRNELATQIIGLTPEHPSRRRVEQEINKIDRDIESAQTSLSRETRERILSKHKADIVQAKTVEEALAREQEVQREQSSYYSNLYNRALLIKKEMRSAYAELDKINEQIDYLQLEADAPGFVRLNSSASPAPPQKVSGNKKIIVVLMVLGLGIGIAVPIGIDMLDRSIKTPGEVHKIMGFAPLAWIVERDDEQSEKFAHDYMRRLALTLARDWRQHQSNYFALTSVKPGGGTTSLALELGCMVSRLGVKTLVLELNAYKPDNRYHDGLTHKGLVTLLDLPDPFDINTVRALTMPATATLPARLPVGKTAQRHLETHGRLPELFSLLNQHYDMLLLDSPPLLLSADAELLAEVASGILLVVEAKEVQPAELRRAASLLERLDPPVVATVLNRGAANSSYFGVLIDEFMSGQKAAPSLMQRLLWKKA